MQDPYSSLTQQGDQNGSFKGYGMSSSVPQGAASYYHEMPYDPFYGLDDTYDAHQISAHQIASNQVHDYPMLQSSHMYETNNSMQPSHQSQLSHQSQPSHQPQLMMTSSLPSQIDSVSNVKLGSPVTCKIKTETLNLDNSNISSPSPNAPSTSYEFSAESGDDKNKAGEEDDKTSVLKKRPLSVPDDQKDGSYWEKRKKNNESAKRSREARRLKEHQIAVRMICLEQENLQMKAEQKLLKEEIERLRILLYGYEK